MNHYLQRLFDNVNISDDFFQFSEQPEIWIENEHFTDIPPTLPTVNIPSEQTVQPYEAGISHSPIQKNLEKKLEIPTSAPDVPEAIIPPEIPPMRREAPSIEPSTPKTETIFIPVEPKATSKHPNVVKPYSDIQPAEPKRVEPTPPLKPTLIEPFEKILEVERDVEPERAANEPNNKELSTPREDPAEAAPLQSLFEPFRLRPESDDDLNKPPQFQTPPTETPKPDVHEKEAPLPEPQIIREQIREVVRIEPPPRPAPRSAAEASQIGPICFGKTNVLDVERGR